jgi:hypothetical protein
VRLEGRKIDPELELMVGTFHLLNQEFQIISGFHTLAVQLTLGTAVTEPERWLPAVLLVEAGARIW